MDAYKTLLNLPTVDQAWSLVLILSVLGTSVVLLERTVYLFVSHQNPELLQALVLRYLDAGDNKMAAKAALLSRSTLGRVLLAGLTAPLEDNSSVARMVMVAKLKEELGLLAQRTSAVACLAGLNGVLSAASLFLGANTETSWTLSGLAIFGATAYLRILLWIKSTEKVVREHISMVEDRLVEPVRLTGYGFPVEVERG